MVFSQAGFEVTHGVSLADAPRVPQALIFITTEASVRFNFLAMVVADTFPRSRSRMTNSLGVHARWSVCMVRPSRCACRFMYYRGKPVTRANAQMTRPR